MTQHSLSGAALMCIFVTGLIGTGYLMVDGAIKTRVALAHRIDEREWHQRQIELQAELTQAKHKAGHLHSSLLTVEERNKALAGRSDSGLLDAAAGPWEPYVATFYSGSGGADGNHVTATGAPTMNELTAAVDPTRIPLGSVIEVAFPNGRTRIFLAQDTGGAIKGNRIDLYMANRNLALAGGIQPVEVRVLVPVGGAK